MYAVKICIYSDGDFSFDEPEFNPCHDEELFYYFENRKDAADAIVRSFNNLKNSWKTSKNYLNHIKEWIDRFSFKMEILAKKIPSFVVLEEFGNQHIEYGLFECKKITLNNGSFHYDFYEPYVDIGFFNYEEDWKWYEIEKLPDMEEE